jgi:hypothetical protein
MRKTLCPSVLLGLLMIGWNLQAQDKGQRLNQPPTPAARDLVKQAVVLAESDKPLAALAALKKARSLSPNYLQAHVEYRNVKANFLNRSDEVDEECGVSPPIRSISWLSISTLMEPTGPNL